MMNLIDTALAYHKTVQDFWRETGKGNEELLEKTGFIFCGGFVVVYPNGGWASTTINDNGQDFNGSFGATVKLSSWSIKNNVLTIKYAGSVSYKHVDWAVFSPSFAKANLKLFGLNTTKMYFGCLYTFWDQWPQSGSTVTFYMDRIKCDLPGAVSHGGTPYMTFSQFTRWPFSQGYSRGSGRNSVPTYLTYNFFLASIDYYNRANKK